MNEHFIGNEYLLINEKLSNGIRCYKYNYTFDEYKNDPGRNQALLKLSKDFNHLIINIQYPIRSSHN